MSSILQDGAVDTRVWILSGMGGVGKTQLAAEYALECWNSRRVDLLVWATALTRQSVTTRFAQAAGDILGVDESDAVTAAERFLSWLSSADVRWLVVLDDVASPAVLTGLWPPSTDGGTVILTTRRKDSSWLSQGRTRLAVDVFTPAEADSYLERKLGSVEDDRNERLGLAQDLGYLPIALAQAASYILDRELTCSSYRRRLMNRRLRLEDVMPEESSVPDGYTSALTATWSLSVEAADSLFPQDAASRALGLAAVLDPNGIPLAVFHTMIVQQWLSRAGGGREDAVMDTETVSDALRNLQRLSLAVVDPATAMLRVHALVQRVTREGWSPEECESVARVAADALTAVWLSVPQHSAEHHVVRNNAVALRKSTGNLLLAGGAHPILVAIGQSLLANGLFPSARTFLTEMRADAEGVLGADHRDTLIITKHLATSVGRCGDLGQAAGMFRELLPQMESTFGASHRETLSVRASILYWDGWANLEGTVAGLQAVVEEQIRTLGHDDADVFLSRHDLARWHARAGRPAQAAVLMRGLWDDQARVLGAGHADVIDTRNDLARFLGWSGAVDEAVRVAADLLPDSVAQLGPFHPLTVNVRHNLAHWKGEAGEPGEAAAELRTSLEQFAAVLGEEHSETFMARTLLGDWLGRAGQTGEAIDTLQQLLEDQRRIVGDRHPDTIRTGLKLDFWRRHHEAGPGAPPVTYEPYASWSEVFTSEERSER